MYLEHGRKAVKDTVRIMPTGIEMKHRRKDRTADFAPYTMSVPMKLARA